MVKMEEDISQQYEQNVEQEHYNPCYIEGNYIYILGITFNIHMVDFYEFTTYISNHGRGNKNGKLHIILNKNSNIETFPMDKDILLEASDTLIGIVNELHKQQNDTRNMEKKRMMELKTQREQQEFRNSIILSILALIVIIGSAILYKYYI